MVNDVLKVMDCYGIQKAHFVGLSLGSVILQSLAMSYPDRVNRMVLAGGLFSADLLFKAFIHLARFANVFFPYRWMYRVFSWLVMPKKRNQLARKIYQQQAALLSQEEYLKWIGLYPQFFELLQDFYGTLTNYPLLLITGDEDYIFLKGARKFHAIQPKSQLKVLHKCGHICNIERPDEFNRHALDFLLE